MVSAAKIIYLVAIVTAVVCAVIALAISPFMKAAILVIITFIKYDTMVFMIIIIVILGLAILCFIIALVVIDMNPGYLGWLLAALWVTFLCLLIAIIIWITNSD
ncbi:unnamed protein product [Schistosoma intercalatum]|nr:unnamed protein product [Schistosoma intercalatum]CAH8614315.1 unnamed protein product [Schistosoma intercalatum]CAH8645695.1 unnamed protein product [Schistosoma haematobium]